VGYPYLDWPPAAPSVTESWAADGFYECFFSQWDQKNSLSTGNFTNRGAHCPAHGGAGEPGCVS
jgi:hypothetical protein